MKAVTVKELSQELTFRTPKELRDLCLRLSRFKKENKELLTYLLFESSDEQLYITNVKQEIDIQFAQINRSSYYLIKKSIRKILAMTRKYIRYSLNKQTEVELLLYFCTKLRKLSPPIDRNTTLMNIYTRLTDTVIRKLPLLHEDLQYDYQLEINELNNKAKP
jgi:vacuolar-type H+-ATPase catalytic subunit A/Vma1